MIETKGATLEGEFGEKEFMRYSVITLRDLAIGDNKDGLIGGWKVLLLHVLLPFPTRLLEDSTHIVKSVFRLIYMLGLLVFSGTLRLCYTLFFTTFLTIAGLFGGLVIKPSVKTTKDAVRRFSESMIADYAAEQGVERPDVSVEDIKITRVDRATNKELDDNE